MYLVALKGDTPRVDSAGEIDLDGCAFLVSAKSIYSSVSIESWTPDGTSTHPGDTVSWEESSFFGGTVGDDFKDDEIESTFIHRKCQSDTIEFTG